ncbi:hypothetical protein QQF64_015587 [Cirrhinus molitorella]|uniref:MCM AAA-lid domain-containing protein n=1 Tax=Cirrhinus molitorella TaxID=172907 RepID=A0ABR3NVW2_9TELE
MLRLSEAMARLYCSDEVQPKHVKEAFRLLNKSIIRVDSPDINFDQEQDEDNVNDQNDLFGKETEGQNGGEVNGHAVEAMDTDEVEKQKRQQQTNLLSECRSLSTRGSPTCWFYTCKRWNNWTRSRL